MTHSDMPASAILSLLRLLEQHAIEVHVDGGWGVDALLAHPLALGAAQGYAMDVLRRKSALGIVNGDVFTGFGIKLPLEKAVMRVL